MDTGAPRIVTGSHLTNYFQSSFWDRVNPKPVAQFDLHKPVYRLKFLSSTSHLDLVT